MSKLKEYFNRKNKLFKQSELKRKNDICKSFDQGVSDFDSIKKANNWLIKNNYIEPVDLSRTWVAQNGYLMVYVRNHPLAKNDTKIYVHRYIMSIHLGRYISTEEHVHHIDENKLNNAIENLQLMTREEHLKEHNPIIERVLPNCKQCGKPLESHQYQNVAFCSYECDQKSRMKFDPSKEELQELVWRHPTTKIAAMFGVSDKAVEKRCKKLDIQKPPRGYWAKLASQSQISTN